MSFTFHIPERLRITLRRLFRRTPPQSESGWVRLDREVPTPSPSAPQETVEMYDANSDSLSRVYCWSLKAYQPGNQAHIYWRRASEPRNAKVSRGLDYYLRSRSVFG